jgi:hypothetical protein
MEDKLSILTSKNIPDSWLKLYPNLVPIIHVVRDLVENHLRLHWLPNSIQTPTTKKDFQEIYSRLASILNYIFDDLSEASVIFTIFKSDSKGFENSEIELYIKELVGISRLEIMEEINLGKQSLLNDYYDDDPKDPILVKFAISAEKIKSTHLSRIIKYVSTDTLTNILFIKPNCSTIVTIYDGGFDIILPTYDQKKLLANQYRDWLPKPGMPYSIEE